MNQGAFVHFTYAFKYIAERPRQMRKLLLHRKSISVLENRYDKDAMRLVMSESNGIKKKQVEKATV